MSLFFLFIAYFMRSHQDWRVWKKYRGGGGEFPGGVVCRRVGGFKPSALCHLFKFSSCFCFLSMLLERTHCFLDLLNMDLTIWQLLEVFVVRLVDSLENITLLHYLFLHGFFRDR